MRYFSEVDSLEIIEEHIKALERLEESEANKILAKYKQIRRELRDRLDYMREDTFTAQQLRGVLAQIDSALLAMADDLKNQFAASSERFTEEAQKDLVEEIRRFEEHFTGAVTPINIETVAAMVNEDSYLINDPLNSSVDAYSAAIRSQLGSSLTQSAIEQVSYSTVVQRMSQFFLGEEWKLHRIARTELHNVYNIGKLTSMGRVQQNTLPDLQKTLMHPRDNRTGKDSEHADDLHLIVNIDEPFVYTWRGKKRVFMAPPDRPNDRAILVPYRKAWGEES